MGIGVVNRGPEETAIQVLCDGEPTGRTTRYRGHGAHSHVWTASLALDLVRRLCLGLPTAG
jgi:hypothetical protein